MVSLSIHPSIHQLSVLIANIAWKALVVEPVNKRLKHDWVFLFESDALLLGFFEPSSQCGAEKVRIVRE
jgi:hypothetical protein